MSLNRESPFRHKVVYSVDDGCSLRQKSIHHERENTMLFSSILVLNGRPFLRCSIVWRQICWIDYQTRFEELMSESKSSFALRKRWSVLNCFKNLLFSSTPISDQMPGYQATNEPKRWTGVVVCKFYCKMDRNEKYWIKNATGRSNLCLSRMFILLES